jgi:hypothetical protein
MLHLLEGMKHLQTVPDKSRTQAHEVRTFASEDGSEEVLCDLLWTLFSKSGAVLSGHRIVHDCVLGIVKESKGIEDLRDTPEYNYVEVWKPIQSEVQQYSPIGLEESRLTWEIRSLLMDYITNDVHAAASVQKTSISLNEMFTKRKGKDASKVIPQNGSHLLASESFRSCSNWITIHKALGKLREKNCTGSLNPPSLVSSCSVREQKK